jgi:hypothetical protein
MFTAHSALQKNPAAKNIPSTMRAKKRTHCQHDRHGVVVPLRSRSARLRRAPPTMLLQCAMRAFAPIR